MNNIKTIEVVKPLTGLEAGDVLTRMDNQSNFELDVEEVTESYSVKRHISISQSLLNKEGFKAVEWFNKIKTNREIIADLTAELALHKEMKDQTADRLKLITSRIDEKLKEYQSKYSEIDRNFQSNRYFGENVEWADEEMTVYHNMIDLLNKIRA